MPPRKDSKAEGADAGAEVVVTVSDSALPKIEAVAGRLKRAGLRVEQVLEITGQITGRCAAKQLDALRAVEGVEDVSISRRIQLPPPGSGTQ